MKSEWPVYQLGDLVSFTSGGTPSKNRREFWGGSIPWVSAKTMKTEHISSSDLMITEEGLQSGSRLAPAGSLLLLIRGSGLFNGIPICYVDSPVAFNQDVKCIDSITEVSNKFIFYWLQSRTDYLKAKLDVTGIGAGKFDLKFLKELPIAIPPLKIRNRIVEIADSISDKIITNNRTNDNLAA